MSSRLALALSAAALIVAVLGSTPLGHALASQVPRNSVGTLQLKRNAVTSSKIAPNVVRTAHVVNGSLLTDDFKSGQIPQGPKGDKGDKGDKGNKGDPGPPGLAAREVVSAVGQPNSIDRKSMTATCPSGKVAVGGGGGTTNGMVVVSGLIQSSPSPGAPAEWLAVAREMVATNANWQVIAYAVCVKVAS